MPELPEVQTILNGIKPLIIGQSITKININFPHLRWPIPPILKSVLKNQSILALTRRGKYLLLKTVNGTLIIHLGMSGRLCVLQTQQPLKKHDHFELHFTNQLSLRFTDPRRFGAILWTADKPEDHSLIKIIGPEPLTKKFNADYLFKKSRNKSVSIKNFIMDSKIVAGVGNIYAAEALFLARIHPCTLTGKLNPNQCKNLVKAIKDVLKKAIKKGGTTLKDYLRSDGTPGYFHLELMVYGKEGHECARCQSILKAIRLAQRITVYCPQCQREDSA